MSEGAPEEEVKQQESEAPGEEAEAPESDPASDEAGALRAKLVEAEGKIAENYDLYVRAMAELDTTRRRSAVEVDKARKYGVDKFASSLLPVVDSIEKALEQHASDEGPLKEGLVAIERQLLHAMEVSGMARFDPKGEKFDPNRHQAVMVVPPSGGMAAGTVASVFQKGWMIQDRVLRPAVVSVVQG